MRSAGYSLANAAIATRQYWLRRAGAAIRGGVWRECMGPCRAGRFRRCWVFVLLSRAPAGVVELTTAGSLECVALG